MTPRAAHPSGRGRAVSVYAVLPAAASRAAAGLARRAREAAPDGRARVRTGQAAARRRAARGGLLGLLVALGSMALLAPAGGATAGPATMAARQPIVEGVRWAEISLPVVVDLGEIPEEWLDPVRAALATWNDANTTFWFVEGTVGSAKLNGVRLQPTERIMLCGGQFNPAACTLPYVYQYGPQNISHVVIQVDRERLRNDRPRRPLDVIDVPALFTHELGHALGLGEAASPTAAMFPAALWSALGADDLRELRAMYGAIQGPRERRAPLPRQPADGGLAPLQPTLRWEPVPSAVGYYVQVATAAVYQAWGGLVDLGFGEYVFDTTTVEPAYLFPRALAEGTEYYWRVKARTTTGNSPWSVAARFVPTTLPVP